MFQSTFWQFNKLCYFLSFLKGKFLMQHCMYLWGQFCQVNLTILSGRAVVSTENTECRGSLAQRHVVLVCF